MTTHRSVGLWMLPAHVAGSRSLLAAVQQDFARLRTLDHPSIARLIELGSNGQQYYVTGERLDGEPLSEVLNHLLPERPEVGEADEIVRAIGGALVYAHGHGIAHGDVRAENIIVTMDRRFVLTNFLGRRIAKMASRPPRPIDDLKGLARLAAELYTGSISMHALRSAAHGDVPAARLSAIRSVLEQGNRRPAGVAEFLEAAELDLPAELPAASAREEPVELADAEQITRPAPIRAPRQIARPMKAHRSRSLWRFVLPATAVALLGLGVAYQRGVGVSAEELKVRGLDALRAVAARVTTPGANAAPENASLVIPETEPEPVGEPDTAVDAEPTPAAETATAAPPVAVEAVMTEAHAAAATTPPVPVPPVAGEPAPAVAQGAQPRATEPAEPAVVALAVPRIAAREDHSVVAIDVLRTGDTSGETSVTWWTMPDTAHQDEDFVGVGRRTLTFPPGADGQRVLIPLVNDGVREAAETLTVHLGRPRGGQAGDVTTTRVTLHDDD